MDQASIIFLRSRCSVRANFTAELYSGSHGGNNNLKSFSSTHQPFSAAQSMYDSAYVAPERWLCKSAPFGIFFKKARSSRGSDFSLSKHCAVFCSGVGPPVLWPDVELANTRIEITSAVANEGFGLDPNDSINAE